MNKPKRGSFGSKFGAIAAIGGSVVGLGNIWRFPYLAGENGGAAFILVYIIVSFTVAIPVMLSEFAIGREAKRNAIGAFKKIAPASFWPFLGSLGIATALVIMTFYSVIAGWSLQFLLDSLLNTFDGWSAEQVKQHFNHFAQSGYTPIVWAIVYVSATAFIVISGIEKGIERYNKILMPLLVLIMVLLVCYSFSLSGFEQGVRFLLYPDFSQLTPTVIMEAVGQAFFSLSLGMGCMITYGSYIKKQENMVHMAATVALCDVSVAVLSGLMIFPAVFSFGISPTSGPELIFITLPNLFSQMTGGYLISILFFLIVFIAAITSTVSLFEVVNAYIHEEFSIGRKRATLITTLMVITLSSMCALSMMANSPIRVMGDNLFIFSDNLASNFMLPIGGLLIVIFAGWFMPKPILEQQLTNSNTVNKRSYRFFYIMIRFVSPIMLALLFLHISGII